MELIMAQTTRPDEPQSQPIDDYQVARDIGAATRPVTHHARNVATAVLLIIVAAVSFALFWVVGTLLGVV
jgi:hypothetical protein